MRKTKFTRNVVSAFAISLIGLSSVSCVDSDYDLNEDIDMTVGIGADGLKFKLGSTQKILMKNVLEVDDDFKTDASNMYYLIKKGSTSSDFNVGSFTSNLDDVYYTTESPVVDYATVVDILGFDGSAGVPVHVEKGTELVLNDPVLADGNFNYLVKDIDDDILSLERLYLEEGVKVNLKVNIENTGMDFRLKNIKNMRIHIPEFLQIADFTGGTIDGNTIVVDDRVINSAGNIEIGEVTVKSIYLGGTPISEQRTMEISSAVTYESDFVFEAASNFEVNETSEVDVSLVVSVRDKNGVAGAMSVHSAEGKFDPVIEPTIDDIDISSSLPDFLKDDDVTISVSNPTFKFISDMNEIPVQLQFNMRTTSKKNGTEMASVWIPGEETKAVLRNNKINTLYFHESQAGPYDPEGVSENADMYMIENISSLVHKLPDFIGVDLADGKVRVDNSRNSIVELNRDYDFSASYNVYVPFEFDAGLKIVYTDSIDDLHDDLQDYEADSAAVSAVIENCVPLELDLELIPLGLDGAELTCIHVDKVKVAAAEGDAPKSSEVYINIRLDNRSDLKKLDKLELRISASSINNGKLNSQQYVQAKDIRLILKGQVVCDFN